MFNLQVVYNDSLFNLTAGKRLAKVKKVKKLDFWN